MRNRQAINWDTLTGLLLQPMSLLLTVTAMILAAFRQDWIEVAAWVFVLEQISTASMWGSWRSGAGSAKTSGMDSRAAQLSATSFRTSEIATTSALGIRVTRCSAWSEPILPAPMIPTFTFSVISPPVLVA